MHGRTNPETIFFDLSNANDSASEQEALTTPLLAGFEISRDRGGQSDLLDVDVNQNSQEGTIVAFSLLCQNMEKQWFQLAETLQGRLSCSCATGDLRPFGDSTCAPHPMNACFACTHYPLFPLSISTFASQF